MDINTTANDDLRMILDTVDRFVERHIPPEELRRRDEERFALQPTGGMLAGRELMIGNGGSEKPKDVAGPYTTRDESSVGG